MKFSQLLHLWLFFFVCGASQSLSNGDEEDDSSNDGFGHDGKLSPPLYSKAESVHIPDFSGDDIADQPTDFMLEKSIEASLKRSNGFQQPKNYSSRVRTGRKKGRKSNQSSTYRPGGSARRKQMKNARVPQRGRYKIKSKDLDILSGFGHIPQKSCPMKYEWLTLKEAVTIDNQVVQVYQSDVHALEGLENLSQIFYTESCFNEVGQRDCPGCCRGIDHSVYTSSCKQRLSYVQALVALPGSQTFFWSHVKVNSSCVCEFSLDLP